MSTTIQDHIAEYGVNTVNPVSSRKQTGVNSQPRFDFSGDEKLNRSLAIRASLLTRLYISISLVDYVIS